MACDDFKMRALVGDEAFELSLRSEAADKLALRAADNLGRKVAACDTIDGAFVLFVFKYEEGSTSHVAGIYTGREAEMARNLAMLEIDLLAE